MRIGAVNYLNSKPLVYGLERCAPDVRVLFDLPSRLADSLAAKRLDVALIPSVEFFRTRGYAIASDACVACTGPVLSVKLYFRVAPSKVRHVALDEGSRTSAALTRILLAEIANVDPTRETLPIGNGISSTTADAVLLIGDRAIQSTATPAPDDDVVEVWDLGEKWCQWTGLPFVFAMWIARDDVDSSAIAGVLETARDEGVENLDEIAAHEASGLNIEADLAAKYLRNNLHFTLGPEELSGLTRFYQLCVKHKLAPCGLEQTLKGCFDNGCIRFQ